jgi:hypothetical protein
MAGNLESQVSILCLNPTGVAASVSGGILRCDRASGDPVEKQVFADCPDRGTTAAVGGNRAFAPDFREKLSDCYATASTAGPHSICFTAAEPDSPWGLYSDIARRANMGSAIHIRLPEARVLHSCRT